MEPDAAIEPDATEEDGEGMVTGVPPVLVVMGVSGSGKSTVGAALARRLARRFADGDDFHPPANVAKMRAGTALTDADRAPWLAALRSLIESHLRTGEGLVLACSALRQSYRDQLCVDADQVAFVYLKGNAALIAQRQANRPEHFMPPGLLTSQFATLEEPADALIVDISPPAEIVVDAILAGLGAPFASAPD
jgi:gluconokinase